MSNSSVTRGLGSSLTFAPLAIFRGELMKIYTFGKSSLTALQGVHPLLVAVVAVALNKSIIDFKVLEGVRTKERQAL